MSLQHPYRKFCLYNFRRSAKTAVSVGVILCVLIICNYYTEKRNLVKLDYWPSIEPWSDVVKKMDTEYIILQHSNCTCRENLPRPLFIIFVFSHPSSWEGRKIIRETWASSTALDHYQKLFNVRLVSFFRLGFLTRPECNGISFTRANPVQGYNSR